MNSCNTSRKIVDFLHNRLSSQERDDFESHVTQCVLCEKLLQKERALDQILLTMPEVSLSPELDAKTLHRIRTCINSEPYPVQSQRTVVLFPLHRWVYAGAAFCCMILLFSVTILPRLLTTKPAHMTVSLIRQNYARTTIPYEDHFLSLYNMGNREIQEVTEVVSSLMPEQETPQTLSSGFYQAINVTAGGKNRRPATIISLMSNH